MPLSNALDAPSKGPRYPTQRPSISLNGGELADPEGDDEGTDRRGVAVKKEDEEESMACGGVRRSLKYKE